MSDLEASIVGAVIVRNVHERDLLSATCLRAGDASRVCIIPKPADLQGLRQREAQTSSDGSRLTYVHIYATRPPDLSSFAPLR